MKMKKYITGLISVSAVVLLSGVAVVSAQTNGSGGTGPGRGFDRPAREVPGANSAQNSTEGQEERTQRIEQRKAELQERLTFMQQRRIEARCENAQAALTNRIEAITTVQTNREKAHTTIVDRLKDLEVKLAAANVNITKYEEAVTTLQTKVETFKTDMNSYIQAVRDTAEMGCTNDPTGFKASLEASRAAMQKLRTDATEIRTYVNDTIKPLLADIKTQLQAAEGAN